VIKKTLLKTNIGLLLEEVLFMQNFKIPLVGRRDTIAICFFRNTIAICYSSIVVHVALAIPFRLALSRFAFRPIVCSPTPADSL
jgi:ABC-type maltose transport system permease subunit